MEKLIILIQLITRFRFEQLNAETIDLGAILPNQSLKSVKFKKKKETSAEIRLKYRVSADSLKQNNS